jgi:hypothetical protein
VHRIEALLREQATDGIAHCAGIVPVDEKGQPHQQAMRERRYISGAGALKWDGRDAGAEPTQRHGLRLLGRATHKRNEVDVMALGQEAKHMVGLDLRPRVGRVWNDLGEEENLHGAAMIQQGSNAREVLQPGAVSTKSTPTKSTIPIVTNCMLGYVRH